MSTDQINEPVSGANLPAGTDLRPSASPLSGPLGIVVAIALLSTAGFLAYRTLYHAEPTPIDPPVVTYICAESGKTFPYKPVIGDTVPVNSPHTGKRTGYPAEKCYWTKDNKQKLIPTYILLNEYKGIKKPTICPDCGRVVMVHNEAPPIGTPIADSSESNSTTTQPTKG